MRGGNPYSISTIYSILVYVTISCAKSNTRKVNGGAYGKPERLPFSDTKYNHIDPFIAPDESFIVFAANRPQYRYAGVPVELGPGIWAIRDVIDGSADNPAQSPAVPDALHWFRSEFASGQTPRTELFITVSITDSRRFLSRSSNAYYITDADKHLYDQDLCSVFQHCPKMAEIAKAAKEAKAVEKKGPPVRTLELVGSPPPGKATKSTSKQM